LETPGGSPRLVSPNDEQLGALLVVGCQTGRDKIASAYAFPTNSNKMTQFEKQHAETWEEVIAMFNNQGFICDAKRTLLWGKKNQSQALMSIFTETMSKKQINLRNNFSKWSKKLAAEIEGEVRDDYKSPAEHVSAMGSLAAAVVAHTSVCSVVAKLLGIKRIELSVAHLQHATFLVVISVLLTGERWSRVYPDWKAPPSGVLGIKKTKPSREFLTSQSVHLVNQDNVITEGRRGPFGIFLWYLVQFARGLITTDTFFSGCLAITLVVPKFDEC
jgi:hypothetical protein